MNKKFEIYLLNNRGTFGFVALVDTFNDACEMVDKKNSEKDSDDYWYVVYECCGSEQLYPQ